MMKMISTLLRGDPSTLRGALFMLLAVLASVGIMVCIRHMAADLHPFVMAFFRSFFGLLVFLPLFLKTGFVPLRTKRLGMQLTRGSIQVVLMLVSFYAISITPLAKFTALRFSGPLFATLLALLILHEIIRMRRISALIIGFAGALIILRPGIIDLDLGAILSLASAATWACAQIALKSLTRTEASSTNTIYAVLVTTPVTFIAALFFWSTPSLTEFGWLVLMGVFGSLSHWSRAQAYKSAEITILLPIDFTSLIWAATFGYIFFGEIADIWTWVGGTIIFASAMYITNRERQVRQEQKSSNPR